MRIRRNTAGFLKTAAIFIASVLLICSAAVFALPGKNVSADVGQPDVPIPALSEVHCASYCVYDKTTGYIVISMNPDDRIYPASMTKIMTCMLSLEYLDTSAKLTVSETALKDLDADSSLMGVLEGEKVKVSELLYGLMLPSGNDAANALGEGCVDAFFEKYPAGGSAVNADGVNAQYILDRLNDNQEHILSSRKLDAFAVLMNLRAEKLGCKGTHFVNACGLPDDNHYTTAYDLAMITRERVKYDLFDRIFSADTYSMPGTNLKSQERVFHSQNWYINGVTPCEGLVMSKVGWTEEAAHTMVTCCERDGLKLICVVMKSINRSDKWKDTTALLDWAFSNYKRISFTGQYIALSADEEMSIDKKGRLYVKKSDIVCPDVSIFMTKGDDDRGIKFNFTNPDISEDLSTVTFDVEIYTGRWATKNVLATVKATAKVSERSAEYVATYARMSLLSDLAMVVIFGILTFTAAMISDVLLNKRI